MSSPLRLIITLPVRALAWLGGLGTRAIAALVVLGIAVPPLGELLRPYVTEAIFLLLIISFMRVDLASLRAYLRRPALVLQAMASPMMASPALAAVMGLDATLVLITLVTSTALVPFTAPLFSAIFLGPMLSLSPLALGIKLGTILAGALAVAAAIRLAFGADAIRRHKAPIDGFNVL